MGAWAGVALDQTREWPHRYATPRLATPGHMTPLVDNRDSTYYHSQSQDLPVGNPLPVPIVTAIFVASTMHYVGRSMTPSSKVVLSALRGTKMPTIVHTALHPRHHMPRSSSLGEAQCYIHGADLERTKHRFFDTIAISDPCRPRPPVTSGLQLHLCPPRLLRLCRSCFFDSPFPP